MERRHFKRIMIIILVTLNAFLGLYLMRQRVSEQAAAFRAERELIELFEADGVTLSPEIIPHTKPPPVIVLNAEEATRARLAAFFLGPDAAPVRPNNALRYVSGSGGVQFHADGSFSATGLSDRTDPQTLCRDFCRVWSYVPPSTVRPGATVIMSAQYGGLPVFGCEASFVFEGDALIEASGALLPRSGAEGDAPSLSAVGALSIFQSTLRESRVVSAEIRRVSLCYTLVGGDENALSLVPAWRIETDTAPYCVNCLTGEVIFS